MRIRIIGIGTLRSREILGEECLSVPYGEGGGCGWRRELGFLEVTVGMQVPPKVKNFLWRACSNCLPTKTNLWSKRVEVNPLCPLCNLERETTTHCLVSCSFASSCWLAAGIGSRHVANDSFACWFELLFKRLDASQRAEAATICWAIWRSRNDLVWN